MISVFVGGMVLHKGEIAEMRTGEGKTLVAILPAYLNALSGKGVHVVTVNDYLARRDCEWVGQVPRFLGLQVGLIQRMSQSFVICSTPALVFLLLVFGWNMNACISNHVEVVILNFLPMNVYYVTFQESSGCL